MTLNLKSIFAQKDLPLLLVVSDTVIAPGHTLLQCCGKLASERVDQIHYFSSEEDPSFVGFHGNTSCDVVFHDLWSDPLGWNGNDDSTSILSLSDLSAKIKCLTLPSTRKIAVILDSLSSLLNYHSVKQVSSWIGQLLEDSEHRGFDIVQVLGLLHEDQHPENVTRAIHFLSNTSVTLLDEASLNFANEGDEIMVEVFHRKASGKVLRQIERLALTDRYDINEEVIKAKAKTVEEDNSPKADPGANLTFNLSLKESERKAKENVELPYTVRINSEPSGNSGQIFYEPDDADDFDEEDPDDDLDI